MRKIAGCMLALMLAACGNGGPNSSTAGTTTLKVHFFGNVATGVLQKTKPKNLVRIEVRALSSAGKVIAGPAIANATNGWTATITVPNGNGIVIVADGLDGQGRRIYTWRSKPLTLIGVPQDVFIDVMQAVVAVQAPKQVGLGATVDLYATVAGVQPQNLTVQWGASAGCGTPTPVANGHARWTAPNTPQVCDIYAWATGDPYQSPNLKGHARIAVKDLTPPNVQFAPHPAVVNTDPYALSGTVSDNVGVASVSATDNGQPIAITRTGGAFQVSISGAGTHTIVITAADTSGNKSVATTQIRINRPPQMQPVVQPVITIQAGQQKVIYAQATDPDGDPITYAFGARVPPFATLQSSSGVITLAPRPQDVGNFFLDVYAIDAYGAASPPQSFAITVQRPKNRAPIADVVGGLVAHYPLDNGVAVDATGRGHDGTITGTPQMDVDRTGAANRAMRFTGVTGQYVRVPYHPDFALTTAFTITAWLKPIAPVAYGCSNTIVSKGSPAMTWNTADIDFVFWGGACPGSTWPKGALVLVVKDTAGQRNTLPSSQVLSFGAWQHVAVTYNNGQVTFYINGVSVGQGTLPSPISNSLGDWLIATNDLASRSSNMVLDDVRIYNRALAPWEVQAIAGATLPEDTYGTVALPAYDPDGDPLTITITALPLNGALYQTPDGVTIGQPITTTGVQVTDPYGRVIYVPNPNYNGPDTIGYQLQDPYGLTATGTAQITVTPVNDPPVIVSPADPYAWSVPEDTYGTLAVSATDIDGDPLAWDVYAQPLHGVASVDAYGNVSYKGYLNYNGPDAFVVRVRDPYGGVALLHVNVTVTPVNDAPVAGQFALSFDGVDDEVVVPDAPSLDITTALTMEAWIYPTGPGGGGVEGGEIINKENAYEIARFADGTIRYALMKNGGWIWVNTGCVAPLGQWTHVALAWDNATQQVRVYCNGSLAYTGTFAGPVDVSTYPLRIGRRQFQGGSAFAGVIDEVLLWNVARTQAQIQTDMMSRAPAANVPGLVGSWTFDEGAGTTAVDVSGHHNHGTLGAGVTVRMPQWVARDHALPEDTYAAVPLGGYDPDGDPLTITITALPLNGALYQTPDGVTIGQPITTTGVQVTDPYGRVIYVPNPNYNGPDTIGYQLKDPYGLTATGTARITVTPVNDPPVLVASGPVDVYAGTAHVFTTTDLYATDIDNTAAQLTYTIQTLPAHGKLRLNGTPLGVGSTFTQADVNAGLVDYITHFVGQDSFTFTLTDGYATPIPGTVQIFASLVGGNLSARSEFPGGVPAGGQARIWAQVTDAQGGPVANVHVRFSVQNSPYASFVQNGLQTLDVYTDTSGMAWATVQDAYAETVPVVVQPVGIATTPASVTVNQVFASNNGVGTVISVANGNNVIGVDPYTGRCEAHWSLAGSPYIVQNSVTVPAGCRLVIDPYTVVKFATWTGLDVNGVLDVYGLPGAEVVFTSINDDAYGGVAPGSTGAPGYSDWFGISYWSGSSGTMQNVRVLYADTGVYIENASPVLTNVIVREFGSSGVALVALSGEVTNPILTNITLTTTATTWNNPLYMYSGGGVVAPTISGGFIQTTQAAGTISDAILVDGAGAAPQVRGLTVVGGSHSVDFFNGAKGVFANNVFTGAVNEAIWFTAGASPSIDATNIVQNAEAPFLYDGLLPAQVPQSVAPAIAGGIHDPYAVHITGNLADPYANYVLTADPLGTGIAPGIDPYDSVWRVVGALIVNPGVRLVVDPYTVVKFEAGGALSVSGVLDVYGQPGGEAVFTSINDDAYGAAVFGSTGAPSYSDWIGISYQSGSSGTMQSAKVLYARTGIYVENASPVLTDVVVREFGWHGLELRAYSGEVTSPRITNLTLTTTKTVWNEPLYMMASGTGVVAPIISGGLIQTADTVGGAIVLNGAGVAPTVSGMTVIGDGSSVAFSRGASGTFTGNVFDGAKNEAIYLAGNSKPTIDATNVVRNTQWAFTLDGQLLPASVYSRLGVNGVNVIDPYSLRIFGILPASPYAYVLTADPLGTGAGPGVDPYDSVWRVVGGLTVASGARLVIDPYTVIKFEGGTLDVSGVLDVYGHPGAEVVFTSINDDAYGAVVAGSTGTPGYLDWSGIRYLSGSSGTIQNAWVLHSSTGIYINNASPVITNVVVREFGSRGLDLWAYTGEVTSPRVTNLTVTTTKAWGTDPVYLFSSGTGVVAPVISGGLIQTADTAGGAIVLNGAGVAPTVSGMTVIGDGSSVAVFSGAGGTFTNNVFRDAASDGVWMATGWNSTGPGVVVLTDNAILNNGGAGIRVDAAPAGTKISRNLIRGNGAIATNGSAIVVGPSGTTNVDIYGNLIVENNALATTDPYAAAVRILGNATTGTGPTVRLYGNTIADNTTVGAGSVAGLAVDAYANVTLVDNILHFNRDGTGALNDIWVSPLATLTEHHNSTTTAAAVGAAGPLAAPTDIYSNQATPTFDAHWYLAAGAPEVNAGSGLVAPYLPANPYAQAFVANTTGTAVDIGYYHAGPAPVADAVQSTVQPTTVNGAAGSVVSLIVTPRDANGALLGAGLQVSASLGVGSVSGAVIGGVRDLGDGRYEVLVDGTNAAVGTADTVTITIANPAPNAAVSLTATINW